MIENLGVFKDKTDGSLKSVFREEAGIVEMTLLFNKEKMDVVCVPTHHFCSLKCKMCHLTNNKLNKQMVKVQADSFIECLKRTVTKDGKRITDKELLLISFMGVGEPLLNLELVESIYTREDEIKSLGYKNIGYAISTMMPNKNVINLTEIVCKHKIPLKLHFSLHTPIDEERKELIPSTIVSVKEALDLLSFYRKEFTKDKELVKKYTLFHRTDDPVEIHYTLIDDVNDGDRELEILTKYLKEYNITIKFIRFNETNSLKRSKNEEKWINHLTNSLPGLRIKTYSPPGREIGSSCGEFTKHYYHEEIETEEEKEEFLRWRESHIVK